MFYIFPINKIKIRILVNGKKSSVGLINNIYFCLGFVSRGRKPIFLSQCFLHWVNFSAFCSPFIM